jgi:hypothetical protein
MNSCNNLIKELLQATARFSMFTLLLFRSSSSTCPSYQRSVEKVDDHPHSIPPTRTMNIAILLAVIGICSTSRGQIPIIYLVSLLCCHATPAFRRAALGFTSHDRPFSARRLCVFPVFLRAFCTRLMRRASDTRRAFKSTSSRSSPRIN